MRMEHRGGIVGVNEKTDSVTEFTDLNGCVSRAIPYLDLSKTPVWVIF